MATIFATGSTFFFTLLLHWIAIILFEPCNVEAQAGKLPNSELNALREIAEQVGKKDWNFSVNPCNGSTWQTPKNVHWEWYNNTLECNCSYPGGVCHVRSIFLKGQDLTGVLPSSIGKLPHIKKVDFTRNYLSGTIPREWASTQLEYLYVTVNRLSGPIPDYLGDFTTLKYMSIEGNLFSGKVPPALGKLPNLVNLILSTNNLLGELPVELANLTNLKEFRISGNNFSGKLPSFVGAWKQLEMLEIEASGLEGPIPFNISVLSNLRELRISDLNGEGSHFPALSSMTNMTLLMLRSCNISGPIPTSIANMPQLKNLDLSFNQLDGHIRDLSLPKVEYMYFTSNLLTGTIPDWIINKPPNTQIDISYNRFAESSVPSSCHESLNLFKSSSEGNNSLISECLKSFPCSEDQYAFHINCGGGKIKIGETEYEADDDVGQAAKFVPRNKIWGFSSTGNVWKRAETHYTAENMSALTMNDSKLYTRARLSPLSLTYYGRCLAVGNYTVTLHFAEIVFRNNKSYFSLGRRIFDVYIQEIRVLKDFNIANEAKGVDREVVIPIKNVSVVNKTLTIRFHWAGKGTMATPFRGAYGPLVSAISVKCDCQPPSSGGKNKIFTVVGAVSLISCVFVILCIAWWKICFRGRISREQELKGIDLQTGFFTLRQIKAATNNFDAANKIGEGGFGSVYKGTLLDGTIIAVKQLSSKSKQGNREFVNGIGIISGLQHPNLVRLYGCCVERNQLLLVYEYMENNSLARALFGPEDCRLVLDWSTRGYMAPEYALWGYLTYKADIYSFGVVALEIVAGKNNMKYRPNEDFVCLLDWAFVLQQKGSLLTLVDPNLGSEFNKDEALRMIKVALLCTNPSPALRPTMSSVVSMLKGRTNIQELIMSPGTYIDGFNLPAFGDQRGNVLLQQNSSETETLNQSLDAAWNASSSLSAHDLYEIDQHEMTPLHHPTIYTK